MVAERPGDATAIRAVHTARFPTDLEARLVDRLRAAGRLSVSLVAEVGGAVVMGEPVYYSRFGFRPAAEFD
jgi:putative acetyltransferase